MAMGQALETTEAKFSLSGGYCEHVSAWHGWDDNV